MGRIFNLTVMRLVTGLPFRDTQCGFKLFRKLGRARDLSPPTVGRLRFLTMEVLYIACHLGYRTLEVPVRWNDVAGTTVSTWRGVKAFWDPVRVRSNGHPAACISRDGPVAGPRAEGAPALLLYR